MRVVAIASPDFAALGALRAERELDLVVTDDLETLRRALRQKTDAILLAPRHASMLAGVWHDAQHVTWIHALSAGVETLPFDLLRCSPVVVTNSRGLYADALAEHVIAAMLWFARDLRRLIVQQAAHRWEPFTVQRLEGRTLGIVGYGGIGQAIGRRAAAMGMRVLSVRRRQEPGDPTLEDVLAESDYVALAAPLTPSTHRLLTRARLGLLRAEAVLINVSRGTVIDEAALIDLLREKRIRGAALDVFETEPLPASSPLWELDNVLLTPHSADKTADSHERAMAFYLENLSRFRRGEPLENVVDKEAGY